MVADILRSPISVMASSLMIAAVPASAGFIPSVAAAVEAFGQVPLHSAATSGFSCELPPVLRPGSDGLPSASDIFSSHEALTKQVERHQAIVRVPSICYDDLGSFEEDKRWEPFHKLHDVLKQTYPTLYVATPDSRKQKN